MDTFGRMALVGLCFGFLWGIGCSMAIIYSIYLTAYRKAVKDSLKPVKPLRYTQVLEKILAKKAKSAAKAAAAPPQ
jgi:hypothetical protein